MIELIVRKEGKTYNLFGCMQMTLFELTIKSCERCKDDTCKIKFQWALFKETKGVKNEQTSL